MSGMDRSGEGRGERRRIGMIAIAWFVRMRSPERTPEDESRFRAWLAEDERHARAFGSIEQVWDSVGDLETMPGFAALRQEKEHERPGVVTRLLKPLHGANARPGRLPRAYTGGVRGLAAAAAMVLLTLTAGGIGAKVWLGDGGQVPSFQTAAGERLHKSLSDGSSMTVSARSEVAVAFSDEVRRIMLRRGQAFFDVAHDAARPFKVEVGGGTVTAVGTGFDILKLADRVIVTVSEGVVAVSGPAGPGGKSRERRLKAGERMVFDARGLGPVEKIDVAQALAWRDGRIHAANVPLIDVIDELNRHSRRQLKVDRSDPQLSHLLVTGQFKIDRPETLVYYLRAPERRVWVARDAEGNVSLRIQADTQPK